jgi:hypothetical protein
MSNGMCCSASHWICSASSAGVIMGTVILRMITDWPETLMATSLDLIFLSWKSRDKVSMTAPLFIT